MSLHPYCVGLTGGIGSGKSTVSERFAELGAAVIDTDLISHQLTGPGGAAIRELVAVFGPEIVTQAGALNRAAMRTRIFSQPTERTRLEAVLHPLIRAEVKRQLHAVTKPYAVLVVPLLTENFATYRPLIDRVAVVDCDDDQQLARTAARPGLDLIQARAILDAQVGRAKRLDIADDVIENRTSLSSLQDRIDGLHQVYLRLALGKSVTT